MADRLPSLTALRAFEAAARHMSFAKAADELHVTAAALSYQIKTLEADLGHPLFRRLNRAVELTEAGRALAPGTSDAFTGLTAAWRNANRVIESDALTVTAGPAFTAKWLAPRLFGFSKDHDGIDLRLLASLRIVDLERDDVDVAIRFGLRPDDRLYSRPLLQDWMSPMMTPEMAAKVQTPADLASQTLIHDDSLMQFSSPVTWDTWNAFEGLVPDKRRGLRFSQADHAIDAAIAGAGIVLGRLSLAVGALESGQLVAPFETCLRLAPQYWFVCPKGSETRPSVAAFEAWVMQELKTAASFSEGRRLVSL